MEYQKQYFHANSNKPNYTGKFGKNFDFGHGFSKNRSRLLRTPDWKELLDWAELNDVLEEILRLIHVTIAWQGKIISIGTSLHNIAKPLAIEILDRWAETERAAAMLLKIARAVQREPEILTPYPPFPSEIKASRQFSKKLKKHYLIAMLTQGIPATEQSAESQWYIKLKLWVLTHALLREFSRNILDPAQCCEPPVGIPLQKAGLPYRLSYTE